MESEEWRVELTTASEARFAISGIRIHRDLIHRKRSPFPYEGKALTRLQLRNDLQCRARHFPYCGERSVAASPDIASLAPLRARLSLLLVGEGGPLAVDEVSMETDA